MSALHPRVVGTGETGLDYYRLNSRSISTWNGSASVSAHIRAARQTGKPLIIHTRSSARTAYAARDARRKRARLAA
ncbi:TatD family hydrolase [Cupriavidus basilensis]